MKENVDQVGQVDQFGRKAMKCQELPVLTAKWKRKRVGQTWSENECRMQMRVKMMKENLDILAVAVSPPEGWKVEVGSFLQ
jgi:hypothetical protein